MKIGEKTKQKLRWTRNWFWVVPISWFDRGMGMINRFGALFGLTALGALFIDWLNQHNILEIPADALWKVIAGIIVFAFFYGWLDQEKLHLTQAEQDRTYRKLNPVIKEMADDLKKIINKLKK